MLASINVIKAGLSHQKKFSKAMEPFGLSHEQFNVLKILEIAQAPMNLKQVQKELLNQTANTTRLVEKLRLKGLVEREISPESRREVLISLTTKGENKLKEVVPALNKIDKELKRNLKDKESLELAKLLKKFMGEE